MTPCGRCLNCRNGAPGICLSPGGAAPATPLRIVARYCRCGEPLHGKFRFCDKCRTISNRETGRLRKLRFDRQVTKNRLSRPIMTSLPEGEKRGACTLVLRGHPRASESILRISPISELRA